MQKNSRHFSLLTNNAHENEKFTFPTILFIKKKSCVEIFSAKENFYDFLSEVLAFTEEITSNFHSLISELPSTLRTNK